MEQQLHKDFGEWQEADGGWVSPTNNATFNFPVMSHMTSQGAEHNTNQWVLPYDRKPNDGALFAWVGVIGSEQVCSMFFGGGPPTAPRLSSLPLPLLATCWVCQLGSTPLSHPLVHPPPTTPLSPLHSPCKALR